MRRLKKTILVAGLALSLDPLVALGQSTPQNPPPGTNPAASSQSTAQQRRRRRHRKRRRQRRRRPVAMMPGNAAFPA
jgi:hypothetical protein